MDHVIDGLADLRFDVFERGLGVAAENEIGKSAERLCRRIRVDGGERSGVPGVQRIEQGSRLDSADFTQDYPVGPPAERDLKRSSKVMLALKVSVWHSTDSRFDFCKCSSDVLR